MDWVLDWLIDWLDSSTLSPYRHDYQRRAVTWMVEREQSILQNLTYPHPLFFPIELEYGKSVYTDYSTGQTVQHEPRLHYPRGGIFSFKIYTIIIHKNILLTGFFQPNFKFEFVEKWRDFSGKCRRAAFWFFPEKTFQGILADEMGLGKTLEMLSLLLTNPKPQSEPHLPVDLVLAKVKKTPARSLTCHCYKRLPGMSTVHCAKCGLLQHAVCWDTEQIPEGQYFLCGPCQREHVCRRGRQDFTYLTHLVQYNTIWLIGWLINWE